LPDDQSFGWKTVYGDDITRVINNTYFETEIEKREVWEQKFEELRNKFKNKSIFKDAHHTASSLKRAEYQLKKFKNC